jgi:hypothetical protein
LRLKTSPYQNKTTLDATKKVEQRYGVKSRDQSKESVVGEKPSRQRLAFPQCDNTQLALLIVKKRVAVKRALKKADVRSGDAAFPFKHLEFDFYFLPLKQYFQFVRFLKRILSKFKTSTINLQKPRLYKEREENG